jgi:hypothetical protein
MSDSELSTASLTSIASRKDLWSKFIDIRSAASSASSVTALNPARNTRHIDTRRSVVPKLIRLTAKQQRVRSNAKKEDLETTQARNIEQFESEDNKELFDDIGDGDSIDSLSLPVNSRDVSQTISRLFSISNGSRQIRKLVSDIWKHFEVIENNNIKCNYCYTIYKINGETRVLRNHLIKEHRIDSINWQTVASAIYDENIETALLCLPEKEKKQKKRQLNIEIAKKINKEHLEYLYLR